MLDQIGKSIVLLGFVLIVIGLVISFFDRIPLLGKLPGDIHIKKGNLHFYFPIATSIVVSFLLSFLFWFFSRLVRK